MGNPGFLLFSRLQIVTWAEPLPAGVGRYRRTDVERGNAGQSHHRGREKLLLEVDPRIRSEKESFPTRLSC